MFRVATALYMYFVVLNVGLLTLVSGVQFDYINQNRWLLPPGSQCGKMQQSPINIRNAQVNNALNSLTFHDYDKPLAGKFKNIGTGVQFVPNTGATLAVSNHKGRYDLQWIRFHWGRDVTEGSEHQFNGIKHAAEIQFVHRKQNVPSTDRDAYAVVAVLAVPVNGAPAQNSVWSDLSVPIVHETSNTVFGSNPYNSLLPTNQNYYYYEGSFTTPLCTESVQWFVFKNTIDIPKGFLDDLRQVQADANGTPLTFNFRDLQNLNGRNIFKSP